MIKEVIIAVILLILINGCSQKDYGIECTEGWKCKDASIKAFQKSDCSWASETVCDLGCENNVCKAKPKTEIRASQQNTEMVISPSNDNIVKGIVTITMTEVPKNTNTVAFAIQGQGIEAVEKTGPNLGTDNDASNGWSYILDTARYNNGVYDIISYAFKTTELGNNTPPVGAASAQIIIQN